MIKPKLFYLLIMLLVCSCQGRFDKVPASNPSFDSIINKANLLSDSGYKEQSLSLVRQAYANSKNLTITDKMNYLTYCNIYFGKTHQYNKSLGIADSMILVLEKNNKPVNLVPLYIEAYNAKADALFALGLYNEATDFYYKAQKLAKENKDSCALGNYSYMLGMALYKQKRFKESAWNFIEAYNLTANCKDEFTYFYLKQEILDNIGLCYVNVKQYDSAVLYYTEAIAYIDANFNRFPLKQPSVYLSAKAVVYGNMAAIYAVKNKYDTAISMYKNSIQMSLQKGYANIDGMTDQVKLAALYYKTNDVPAMKKILQDIKVELDSMPDKKVELSWDKLMWEYYDRLKDPVNAYKYLSAYVYINDSFTNKDNSLMEMDVDERVKNAGKEYQIALLNKDNEKKKVDLIVSVIFLVMSFIIIILILINAARFRKNVKNLTRLNDKVNEQKAKLEVALVELNLKDKDKSRILRSVAHDIMNPISAIIALTEILIGDAENWQEEQKEILSLIKQACNNSLNLSKDILEAAIEIDASNMSREWTNITKVVANSVELLNIRAAAKQQKISITSSSDDIQAYVNKDKIWRAVNNLVGNAIKFSHPSSEIKINVSLVKDQVHISVMDKGIGIPEKNRQNIFDMFTESKLRGTAGEIPHGMGLSISLQIAKAHGGNIWVESEEGLGSTFYLEFPVNNAH